MRAPTQPRGGAARTAKGWLFATAIVLATVCLAQDSRPASASDGQVLLGPSASNPVRQQVFYLVPGGEREVYVWAKNVAQPVSGFQLDITYDASIVSLTDAVAYEEWLESGSGRDAMCGVALIEPVYSWDPDGPWHFNVSCVTLGPEGTGAQGTGLLAEFALAPAEELGLTGLALTEDAFLLDMNFFPPDYIPGQIPIDLLSSSAYAVPCADFTGDGMVRIPDIVFVVGYYGMEGDPIADTTDLDGDGFIRVPDILIAVGQYGMDCQR